MISGWIMHLVPWWVWLLLSAIAMSTAWRLLGWQGALAAAAGLLAVLGYGKGRNDALTERDARDARQRADAMKNRKEIDDATVGMDTTSVDRELDRWMRDDSR